ncbi:MAG: thioredoxin domain-containing protein [Xanthomonadales bacterium]|nr:thioredoxin domain-containing protein [Xanthomonadales bacterium]
MNRLQDQTSAYLLQHADNPVHWYPWGNEAMAEARDSGRPILLSIGYSACHWCHVMAHESFEDAATAEVMNDLYVNVKLDREEHPELDRIYQLSHQLLTGRGGGWPLTVFLAPDDLTPFFAGTYFPKAARAGMPAFTEVLRRVRAWYDEHPEQVREQAQQLVNALQVTTAGSDAADPSGLPQRLAEQAVERLDRNHGGFGGAPKFPQGPILVALGRISDGGVPAVDDALALTLRHIVFGGLRDVLDGGFFRYCVDGTWTIPHFEKMLYDNALLLRALARDPAAEPLVSAADGIFEWLEAEMRLVNGAYAASYDADADGVEGGYHVWTREQVTDVLDDPDERAAAVAAFGLDRPPNFEGHAWHLVQREPVTKEHEAPLAGAVGRLRAAREERTPPGRDDKVLLGWNAMTATALAEGAVRLDRPAWGERAIGLLAALERLNRHDGRWLGVAGDRDQPLYALLEDEAALLEAQLAVLRFRWDATRLNAAITLADGLLERFGDAAGGALFDAPPERPVPMARLKSLQDDATPAGNGIAARALIELGHLLGEVRYLDAAEAIVRAGAGDAARYPLAYATLSAAAADLAAPVPTVVIVGDADVSWVSAAHARPTRVYHLPEADPDGPGVLSAYRPDGPVTAWVCHGTACEPPVTTPGALSEALQAATSGG